MTGRTGSGAESEPGTDLAPGVEALRVHSSCSIIDTHVDTIVRCVDLEQDLGRELDLGYMDLPKMRAGNLGAAFFACCVEPQHVARGSARARLWQLIDAVHDLCRRNSGQLGLAQSAVEIRSLAAEGKRAVVLSIEGAQGIGDELSELDRLYASGVRVIGPTHFRSNAWGDSCTDRPLHGGLSALGRRAIATMNSMGIIIDVSHLSDGAFWQTIEASERPLLASHSSARAIVEHPRNMTDEMISAVAARGGLIGVTWWPEYVSEKFEAELTALLRGEGGENDDPGDAVSGSRSAIDRLLARCGGPWERYTALVDAGIHFPSVQDVLEHIDHVAGIAGTDHVCIGSDHGAVYFEIRGLEHCGKLACLTEHLLSRGYSASDVRKIYGENVLRFMDRVQQ